MSSTHGWNQDSLEFAFAQLRALPFTRAMIVRRRGETVAEEYFNDGSETYPNNQRSITKSITSALYGIAIERGLLPSLDVPIAEFLPRAYSRVTDRRKFDIHFRHLITMTAGLDADDNTPAADPSDELDRARFVLNRPMIARPGERYAYYSPYCGLLLQMLESIVKRPALDFANEFLFDPLGIEVGGWYRSPRLSRWCDVLDRPGYGQVRRALFKRRSSSWAPDPFARMDRRLVPASYQDRRARHLHGLLVVFEARNRQ
jgi:CubicO group peptidase (beta-lactamase class C family)